MQAAYKGLLYNSNIPVLSKSPSAWCQKYWIHWRAVKSAFSVERQLREITTKLKQVKKYNFWICLSCINLYLRGVVDAEPLPGGCCLSPVETKALKYFWRAPLPGVTQVQWWKWARRRIFLLSSVQRETQSLKAMGWRGFDCFFLKKDPD